MIGEIVSAIFMLLGAVFIVLGAVGVLRMPDLFLRMSCSTKAATLGVGLTLIATAVYFDDLAVSSRAVAATAFLILTAPVAAHVIGRAAYLEGVTLWEKTVLDELQGQYEGAGASDTGPASPEPSDPRAARPSKGEALRRSPRHDIVDRSGGN